MAKQKQKTKKAAAKRFKITGSGKKIKFDGAGVRHIATGYSRKRNRQLKGTRVGHKSDLKRVLACLPNGSVM